MGIKDKMMGMFMKNMLKNMNDDQKKDLVRQSLVKMMPNLSESEREAMIAKSMPLMLEMMSDPDRMMKMVEQAKKDGKIPPEMQNLV